MRTHVILAACAACQGWATGHGPENGSDGSDGSDGSEFQDQTSTIVFYTSKMHAFGIQIAPLVSRSTFPKLLPFGISFVAQILHFAKSIGRKGQFDATV